MTEYIIVRGDTLSGIARRHGIRYWQNIYPATENEAFGNQRTYPNRIFPGDHVHNPGLDSIIPMERRKIGPVDDRIQRLGVPM